MSSGTVTISIERYKDFIDWEIKELERVTGKKFRKRLKVTYQAIKQRCYNPNHVSAKHYSEKGIEMCDEWFNSFDAFESWALNNGYLPGLSIDRKFNDEGYNPYNCRWATVQEQNNNKSNTIRLKVNGEVRTLLDWCKYYEMSRWVVKKRIVQGWDAEHALTCPIKKGGKARNVTVFNPLTGIYYNNVRDAANALGLRYGTMKSYLNGNSKNKTPMLYV